MWYRVVMLSSLIGRVLTVTILTKFNYVEAAGGLALLFTTSTLFNNALPPLHKDIYIKAVKNRVYDFREIFINYFYPLFLISIFSSFFVCILIKSFF